MAKIKKRRKSKAAPAEEKGPDLTKVIEAVTGLAALQVYVSAQLKLAVNRLNTELGLSLDVASMTAAEAEKIARVSTPFGVATAGPGPGEAPQPANGEHYTAEELTDPGTFTRPVLARILEDLGGDSKGKMPPDLRTAILEIGTPADLGMCDFTGDAGVAVTEYEVDGDTYICGPKVLALMKKKKATTAKKREKILRQLIEEEISL